jgi:Domain of unknown function (DUF4276)
MKNLYIIVEGETEVEFINRMLIPYFYECGIISHIQAIPVSMSGGGHGFNNIEHFKNTIKPLLKYNDKPYITTMIDHYGINSEKKLPNYSICAQKQGAEAKISCLEESLNNVVQSIEKYPFFIPNIIRHEMETLLFANPDSGFDLENVKIKNAVLEIYKKFPNIEDINDTPQGAPSKRLDQIYKANGQEYKKVADAVDIAELTGITIILKKCPKFKAWIENIISTLKS